ncbi:hypothetical protein K437DRAFT_268516 [Tilletiaria anomala UBC 951]|uniref:Large ribosomal subunit protein uL30m n=1 Tax=Tilletiaria anomala (strain ATCC 24038 / CBS 436.72 / UBC 951) TaxID=1037660 RepID=A0A066W3A3_TILAU|nr:uncharacterized protein K437DRAFT_268516 [Tilletiaria anomala UBC 951]KDN45255.1 hypothetical protein K437DRAFT_268516 [Tilletiaria anomala UBC 951]
MPASSSAIPSSAATLASASTSSATTAFAHQQPQPTTHYRITLRRSAIGLPEKTSRVLESLGLRKRLQSIYRPQRPEIAGSILKVKELLHVDNVRRIDLAPEDALLPDEEARWVDAKGEVIDWGKDCRKAPRGFKVVGSRIDL